MSKPNFGDLPVLRALVIDRFLELNQIEFIFEVLLKEAGSIPDLAAMYSDEILKAEEYASKTFQTYLRKLMETK